MSKRQIATLKILYSEIPQRPGGCFLQIRQWETPGGDFSELIIEQGHMDDEGDLQTKCQVMPFHMTLRELFAAMGK